MPKILKTKSIYYNDCNLIAQPAHPTLKSRKDIPVELNRIIVSPMDAVVGKTFAQEASKLGLTVCLHRFCDISSQLETFKVTNPTNTYVSIGLNDWDRVEIFKDYTTNWLIDCANGYLSSVKDTICKLQSTAKIKNLMLGNIHSKEGIEIYRKYEDKPFNILFRVGIAGGCFVPESTVKTKEGLKEIQNIKIGDEVLTHTGEYNRVTNKFEYEKNEELISINGITCTKNHEFYVIDKKYENIINESNYKQYAEWRKAEDLTDEYFLIEL